MENLTYTEAKKIIKCYSGETNYFNGTVDINDMWDTLRYRCQFGEAESAVIIASLVMSGAKFKGRLK